MGSSYTGRMGPCLEKSEHQFTNSACSLRVRVEEPKNGLSTRRWKVLVCADTGHGVSRQTASPPHSKQGYGPLVSSSHAGVPKGIDYFVASPLSMSTCPGVGLHEHRHRTPDPFPEVLPLIAPSLPPRGVLTKLQIVSFHGPCSYYLHPQPQCRTKHAFLCIVT